MRLYHHVYARDRAEAILTSGFKDEPLYAEDVVSAEEWNPVGVVLRDDPILLYEHLGAELIRVELDASEESLSPYEDLRPGRGVYFDTPEFQEDAWFRTGIPAVGTTYREWIVPESWLRPRILSIQIVDEDPEKLWEAVARDRKPRPTARAQDAIDKQLAVLARAVHGRRFDSYWGIEREQDKRIGTLAIQESIAIAHFEKLVDRLTRQNIPLDRCAWLLAEAARRVAVDSYRLGKYVRQKRAAKGKSATARALDDAEVKSEAQRLSNEGVPIARIRRRLLAKFGPDRVPSETVIRRQWLPYHRLGRP